jgi:hypothetical protein
MIVLCVSVLGYTAVTQIAGLAVAGPGATWNNLRDASIGDGITSGIAATSSYLFTGTTFERLRGDSNGLRIQGTVFPNDALTNPSNAISTYALQGGWNGSAWDLQRSLSAANNTAATSNGVPYAATLSTWNQTSAPAANTQATTTKAAGGGTVRHVTTSVTWCFATDTAAGAGPFAINLRDGASGAGTVLRTWYANLPAAENSTCFGLSGLNITGSANTAMTLEFAAAGGAATLETVGFSGYSTP